MKPENKISSQIKVLRSKMGWSQSQLADKLGVSKQSVSNWETNLKTPRMGALQKMSDLFGVSIGQITDGDRFENNLIKQTAQLMQGLPYSKQQEVFDFAKSRLTLNVNSNVIKFPKDDDTLEITASGVLSAGVGEFLDDSTKPFTVTVHKPVPRNYDYAFQINGHSMEPVYQDKQVVFVKKEDDYRDGQIIAAVMDGCAYLKKLSVVDGEATLVSLNPQYPNIKVDKETGIKVLGVVFS
ncbi:XRE family transcriptional regulator [Levilactobacillus tongjiangensis]|uniref:S24 family peptidase n=1 Tax=Levilactobacillus tongjiangensis TaxID=2486023 RepID=A0ABW1SVW1_9LACO|nr:XRE family transcriptional regulator [Levilactobacillus tongjiangensis]